MVCHVHVFFGNAGNIELGGNLLHEETVQIMVAMNVSIAKGLTLLPSADSLNSTLHRRAVVASIDLRGVSANDSQ